MHCWHRYHTLSDGRIAAITAFAAPTMGAAAAIPLGIIQGYIHVCSSAAGRLNHEMISHFGGAADNNRHAVRSKGAEYGTSPR